MSEVAKGKLNSKNLGQQNYISNPRVSDFGTTDNGCDLWMFGFHFLTNSVGSFL